MISQLVQASTGTVCKPLVKLYSSKSCVYALTDTVATHAIAFLLADGAARVIGSRLRKEVTDEAASFNCTSGGRASHDGRSAESDKSEEELGRLHVSC